MKKIMTFIFITALILNLLPQTSTALTLHIKNNSVTYDAFKEEKEMWEKFYLPHAKHFKLISKNATVLDVLKIAKDEEEKGINSTIIHKIMDTTEHTRCKLLVKWERDNGYIDEEAETRHKITPTVRRELLQEIEEEEKKEKQFSWEKLKVWGKVYTAGTAFVVAKFFKKDILSAATIATLLAVATTTVIEILAFKEKSNDEEDEIKIPPLRNTDSRLPKNYKRVDLYSL
jgi:hypothetical protein